MENERYGTYWTQTETYESLKIYIDMDEDGLKEAIISMLGGEACAIDVMTFQNDMTSIHSKDDVLTLLVHLGYLAYDADAQTVHIPNEEIRREFIRAVKNGRHTEIANLIRESDRLLQDTLHMEGKKVAEAIDQIKKRNYPQVFEGYGSDILLVGISYDEKTKKHDCMIEKYELRQHMTTGERKDDT